MSDRKGSLQARLPSGSVQGEGAQGNPNLCHEKRKREGEMLVRNFVKANSERALLATQILVTK